MLLAAAALAPLVSWIGYLSDRPGMVSAAALAGVAAVVLVTGSSRELLAAVQGLLAPEAPRRLVQAAFDLTAAGFIVWVLPADRRTRLWSLGLTVPGVWIAAHLIEPLYSRLLG